MGTSIITNFSNNNQHNKLVSCFQKKAEKTGINSSILSTAALLSTYEANDFSGLPWLRHM